MVEVSKIHVLNQDTINKIAAGEVIERPMAVVKELTENAIDADATAVTVEVKDGGKALIRMTDNGVGMNKEDIRLAFTPHATSKIEDAKDLLKVATLGFRGEALASISSVSQLEMVTKTRNELMGSRYEADGGVERTLEDVGCPDGTTILVRNLFYNTPARLKFLKSSPTEAGYINTLIERLALSHPEISFRFINQNQTKLHTSGNGNLKDVIYHIYGRDITANLLEVDADEVSCQVKGFIGKPVVSRGNRNYMNYFINLHYLRVSTPSGYSEDKVSDILKEADSTRTTTGSDTTATTSVPLTDGKGTTQKMATNASFTKNTSLNGKKPNIILIMNESLADFSLVGDVRYNRDPLSYIHSLTKNTIKGRDYVSVFGAGTSNSEFEAMTGNTMAFFPSGCNVYQQFMHNSTFSLPSYLKEQGYSCKAVHPSSGANWNRIATYKSMKFDDFITIDDFKKPEYVRYISDKESYKKVIELYENKGDKPLYLFDMTIQNHGGYLTNTNWKTPVYVEGSYYTEAKEYLSATHVSDQAFQYLLNYFSKQTEPTIICMFGDHFPSIETAFYEELLGKPQSEWNLEDIQKRYAVPFIIWANYDIEEEQNAVISNNYLENMLLKQAGIDLPHYNQYLEKLSADIPAMNVNGYMDTEGKWHNYDSDETDTVKKLLEDYEILQYGYYSDMNKDKMSELFQMKH